MSFEKATKRQARLRAAIVGPSGSGKTYTSLLLAGSLGTKVAVIDTERGSASKYADLFGFDVCELTDYHPTRYVEAINDAATAGYDVLVIDSFSHAWQSELDLVDKAAAKSQSKNTYFAWRDVTPLHNALVDAILQAPMHVIVTMRAKTEYVIETDNRGKQVPKKIGMAPVQRAGVEYEFDVVADMDLENNFIVSKTRCPQLTGEVFHRPGKQLADVLNAWLSDGAEVPPPAENTDRPAFTAADELLAGPEWVKKFNGYCRENGFTEEEVADLIERATDQRIRTPKSVREDEAAAVKAEAQTLAKAKNEEVLA